MIFMSVYNEAVQESLNSLRDVFKFIRDGKDTKSSLIHFGCYAPSTKGSGISTVIGGIYLAIKHYQNPEQAILEAVNSIGTDTDSVAAFAGGLIGCLYENEIIPEKWKNIQDSAYLNVIAQNLFEISNNGNIETTKVEIELNLKSLNEISSDEYIEKEEIFFESLGKGIITNIDRQKTLTSGKYNLIIDVNFEIGQTCKFSKLLDIEKNEAERYFK
jgi:hypothetical protein